METYLKRIANLIPSEQILLLTPVPMRPGAWVYEPRLLAESARLGICYETLAAQIGTGFADAGLWDIELSFDGVHLTPEGHRVFAEKVLELLQHGFS